MTQNLVQNPNPGTKIKFTTTSKLGSRICYETNPFISVEQAGDETVKVKERLKVPICTKMKHITAASPDDIARKDYYLNTDPNGNEEIITHTFMEQYFVDNDQFIKIYSRYITHWLLELTKAAQRALVIVLTIYQNEGINRDLVYINYKAASEIDEKIAARTFQRGLAELHKAAILAPAAKGHGWYFINPHYFFNGDRIAFGKVITKRNEKAAAQQTMLDLEDAAKNGLTLE